MTKLMLAAGVVAETNGLLAGIILLVILIGGIFLLAVDFDAVKQNRKDKKEEKKRYKDAMKDKEFD